MRIDHAAFVALAATIASCHANESRMVVAPVEPDSLGDAGVGSDASNLDTKIVSCDDEVRARPCSELRGPSDEDVVPACNNFRKRLRPSAFNRLVECAKERGESLTAEEMTACIDTTEGRCIDPTTKEPCENALRTCVPSRRRRTIKATVAVCQATVSALQPRYRSKFYGCMTENCDPESLRECLAARQ